MEDGGEMLGFFVLESVRSKPGLQDQERLRAAEKTTLIEMYRGCTIKVVVMRVFLAF